MGYVAVIVIMGVLVFVHESGHFIAARVAGIPVARFSVGFGPGLWSLRKGGTEYRISAVPLGGYVLPGMNDEKEFFELPVHKRIIFSLGGPLANIIFTLILFAVINTVTRGFSLRAVFITPFSQTLDFMYKILCVIPGIFSGSAQLSGVAGIVFQGGRFIGSDVLKMINFSIMLGLNLTVFNLLPVPALDGGKIVLYIMEKIDPRMARLHLPFVIAGWIFMLLLMLYATFLDVAKYFI